MGIISKWRSLFNTVFCRIANFKGIWRDFSGVSKIFSFWRGAFMATTTRSSHFWLGGSEADFPTMPLSMQISFVTVSTGLSFWSQNLGPFLHLAKFDFFYVGRKMSKCHPWTNHARLGFAQWEVFNGCCAQHAARWWRAWRLWRPIPWRPGSHQNP